MNRKINETYQNNAGRFGLVLCGGGAKGAYQIGVWHCLLETGIAGRIGAISGASVGALNALLIAQGDAEQAKQVWLSATPDKMLSESRLSHLIENSIYRWDLFSAKEIQIHAAISEISPYNGSVSPVYVQLNGLSKPEIIRTVLASSAVPGIFKPKRIDKKICVDGGIADNIPVRPLIEEGVRDILVVHLDHRSPLEELLFRRSLAGLDVGDARFYHIYPGRKMMPQDFFLLHKKHSAELMARGYQDAAIMLNGFHSRKQYA